MAGSRREGKSPPGGHARLWGWHAWMMPAPSPQVGGFRAWRASGRGKQGSRAACAQQGPRLPALTPRPNKGIIRHPKPHLLWGQGRHFPACTGQSPAGACKHDSRTLHGNQLWLAAGFLHSRHTRLGKYCLQVYLLPGASHSQDMSEQCLESYQNSLCRKLL